MTSPPRSGHSKRSSRERLGSLSDALTGMIHRIVSCARVLLWTRATKSVYAMLDRPQEIGYDHNLQYHIKYIIDAYVSSMAWHPTAFLFTSCGAANGADAISIWGIQRGVVLVVLPHLRSNSQHHCNHNRNHQLTKREKKTKEIAIKQKRCDR